MPAAVTLTAAAMPAANAGVAGIKSAGSANGANSAGFTFSGGTPGALDTIDNANLIKGSAVTSRIYAFLNASYASQADLNAAIAALGVTVDTFDASTFRFITAAPGKPTATLTTIAATGALRISVGASING